MATLNIPKGNLRAGTRTFGPFNVAAHWSSFALDAQLSQPVGAGNSFDVQVQRSFDSGATWQTFAEGACAGGATFPDANGNDFVLSGQFWGSGGPNTVGDEPAIQAQVVVSVVGATLNVAGGSVVVS